jgi:uncharacterized protein (TIGR02265 family)
MDDRKAKGTMFLDFVKMIKANKHLDWGKYLQPGDWDVIDSIILPSKWYPFDVYYRCSMAVFDLIGKGSLEAAHANGRMMGEKLFETTYRSVVQRKDPMLGLSQFVATYGALFNFSRMHMEKLGPKHCRIFHDYDAKDKANIAYCHQLKGIFEVLLQKADGKNGKVMIGTKQWENAPSTAFDISWE